MTKTLGLLALLFANVAWGLVPLEGLLKGEVREDLQFDPMSLVFQIPADAPEAPKQLFQRYLAYFEESQRLKNSCEYVGTASYATPEAEARAKRSVVATLQYLGLDLTTKHIGSYARTLQMSEADYKKMGEALIKSSCSPNLSVYGINLLKQNLLAAYNTSTAKLPALPGQPFTSQLLAEKASSLAAKEQEFHHTTQLFRAFCAWGGDSENYRLLPPLLKSPAVMSWLYRHLEGQDLSWSAKEKKFALSELAATNQVICEDYLCRRVPQAQFRQRFPLTVGSSGLKQDLQRLWCHHFRFKDLSAAEGQHPLVREWIKKFDPEHEHQLAAQMVALVTGVADLLVTTKSYADLAEDLRSGIDERWNRWAKDSLAQFSKDMLYEESLEIKIKPRRNPAQIRDELFAVDMAVTMGELDRIIEVDDKLTLQLDLKLSRNMLRWMRVQWSVLNELADPAKRDAFIDEVAQRLKPQIDAKKKYFPNPLIGEGLEQLLAQELMEQVLLYQGKLFDTYEDEMLTVPVRLRYGMFALSYMRYKALIKQKFKTLDL